MIQRTDGTKAEAFLYFDKYNLKEGMLYIDIDSIYSYKMKTEDFKLKLK